ncbi:MAG: hypothetical protein KGV57_04520 [Fusobacterium sp.]|nr:hypothetical protein [Fusobacterium sp.]
MKRYGKKYEKLENLETLIDKCTTGDLQEKLIDVLKNNFVPKYIFMNYRV